MQLPVMIDWVLQFQGHWLRRR